MGDDRQRIVRRLWETIRGLDAENVRNYPAASRLIDAGADSADVVRAMSAAAYEATFNALFPTRSTEVNTAGQSSEQTHSASGRVKMPVGHCWIDPVRFDGLEWVVMPQDQFGWGGGTPGHWDGQGVITRLSESGSRYADRGGHVLRLVSADDPEAAAVFMENCD